MPHTKYQCLVLCLKSFMPKIEPTLPPKMATKKSVASEIRQDLLMAFRLSIPIRAKPMRLIIRIYPIIHIDVFIIFTPKNKVTSSFHIIYRLRHTTQD